MHEGQVVNKGELVVDGNDALLHPGRVATDMLGGEGDIGPDEAAANLLARMDTLTLADTGSFWHADGTVLPW